MLILVSICMSFLFFEQGPLLCRNSNTYITFIAYPNTHTHTHLHTKGGAVSIMEQETQKGVDFRNVNFTMNQAYNGGAVHILIGRYNFTNVICSHNVATFSGGCVFNEAPDGSSHIQNSIINDNNVSYSGFGFIFTHIFFCFFFIFILSMSM